MSTAGRRDSRSEPGRRALERALGSGVAAYEGTLARWWLGRASDGPHRRAYRTVADYLAASFPRAPRSIADYGCGAGHLLARLARRFPRARLIGYDASATLLARAVRRLARGAVGGRVRLRRTVLPDFRLAGSADLVIFAFPNILPRRPERERAANERRLGRRTTRLARTLARGLPEGRRDPAVRARLLHDRALALNLHGLLAPGGICVRVEYAACRREKLGRGDLLAVAFAEGSLDPRLVDGGKVRQLFRVVAARHVRSRVIEDVRQQAGGVREPSGGYTITVLRRI